MIKPLLASLALGAAALAASAQTTWEAATPFPETSLHTENLAQFAKDVERASEGKLKIAIKSDAALKPADAKRAVQNGKLALAEIRLADVQSEWATFGVDSIPMLAAGYGPARKLYQAQRVPVGKKLAGQGLVMLYSVPSPPPGLFLKKPVSKLVELRGHQGGHRGRKAWLDGVRGAPPALPGPAQGHGHGRHHPRRAAAHRAAEDRGRAHARRVAAAHRPRRPAAHRRLPPLSRVKRRGFTWVCRFHVPGGREAAPGPRSLQSGRSRTINSFSNRR